MCLNFDILFNEKESDELFFKNKIQCCLYVILIPQKSRYDAGAPFLYLEFNEFLFTHTKKIPSLPALCLETYTCNKILKRLMQVYHMQNMADLTRPP